MKRLSRVMFNGLTLLSLLLSIAFAGLWGRSYVKREEVWFAGRDRVEEVVISNRVNGIMGSITEWYDVEFNPSPLAYRYFSLPPRRNNLEHSWFGIQWVAHVYPGYYVAHLIIIPHAYFIILFALLPAFRLYRRIRRRAHFSSRPLPRVWLRSPRHPRPLPGVRRGAGDGVSIAIVPPIACGRLHIMKRWLRVMLNALTILSLLLSLAFAGLWGRSYVKCDLASFMCHDTLWGIGILNHRNGVMGFTREWYYRDSARLPGFRYGSEAPRSADFARSRFGIQREPGVTLWSGVSRAILIPHAYFILLFASLPALWLYRRIRRRATRLPGHCRACGYDLRATPDRCPECGAVPAGV